MECGSQVEEQASTVVKSKLLLLLALYIPVALGQADYPPAYPREGATNVLENEHVIVWDISWLQEDYPFHRHRYDHTGVYYQPGDRIITSVEGEEREVHTDPWNISFQLAEVTHRESGISTEPLQAVFIQMKRPVSGAVATDSSLPVFPHNNPLERRVNDRVRVWEYNSTVSGAEAAHVHKHDAVVVWFDADTQPNVHFVTAGTSHLTDVPSAAARVFVFEIL